MPKKKPVNLDFAFELEPAAAMDYFRSKGYTLSWDFHDTLGEAHASAFTVAHVAKMDILQDIRGAVDEAIADGQTFAEFRKGLEPTLKKKGWWGKNKRENPQTGEVESVLEGSPHRLRTIYYTNMKSAYNAGREEFFQRNKKNRPYGQFVAVMDPKTRDEHGRLHNKVFHLDDPFWDRFTPPIDYNCRCRKRAITEAMAKRKGLKILSSEGRMVREDRLVSKKTGELRPTWGYKLPGGDKIFTQVGFDHNQWKAAYQPDLDSYDLDIAKKYIEGAVTGPAFRRFVQGKTGGKLPLAVLDPRTQKRLKSKTRTVHLSEEVRDKKKATLPQYRNVHKIIDSSDPIYLPGNRVGYVSGQGAKQRLTVIETSRDKSEISLVSTSIVDKKTIENLKKGET